MFFFHDLQLWTDDRCKGKMIEGTLKIIKRNTKAFIKEEHFCSDGQAASRGALHMITVVSIVI